MEIREFKGENFFLSNFWMEPGLADRLWGYPSTEHYYQAMKTPDIIVRAKFKVGTPGQAKRFGRNVRLRPDWEEIKDEVMLTGLRRKFILDSGLDEKLLATNPHVLIEGNDWHDNYWGDCSCPKCKNIPGKNMLGVLLMKVREEIMQARLFG